jgi:hypothetical protein
MPHRFTSPSFTIMTTPIEDAAIAFTVVKPFATSNGPHVWVVQVPPLHEWPHFPQSVDAFSRSTQVAPQSVSVPGHACRHEPPVQATEPPVGAVHFVHDGPHASTVSPLQEEASGAVRPPLVPFSLLPLLDPGPPSAPGVPVVGPGSSPTHAARTTRVKTEVAAQTAKVRRIHR